MFDRGYVMSKRPRKNRRPHYFLGVDLGQKNDYTAIAVLRCEVYAKGKEIERTDRVFELTDYERVPLQTRYPQIVTHVSKLYRRMEKEAGELFLLVDRTGIGRAIWDMFQEAGLDPVGVTMTAGHQVTDGDQPYTCNVPKIDLVHSLLRLLEQDRIKISTDNQFFLPFRRELSEYKIKPSLSRPGSVTLEAARDGDHDDLIIAASMCTWAATSSNFSRYAPGPSVSFVC